MKMWEKTNWKCAFDKKPYILSLVTYLTGNTHDLNPPSEFYTVIFTMRFFRQQRMRRKPHLPTPSAQIRNRMEQYRLSHWNINDDSFYGRLGICGDVLIETHLISFLFI